MLDELREAVESLPGSGARCLLLTGEGRGFSSGADLASGGGLPDDVGAALEAAFQPADRGDLRLPDAGRRGGERAVRRAPAAAWRSPPTS